MKSYFAYVRVSTTGQTTENQIQEIEAAGFRVERLDAAYMRGPNPLTWMYEGSARPS